MPPIEPSKLEMLEGNTVMGISMNPKTSGFRNWAEIHEPAKIDEARIGAKEGEVDAPMDVGQEVRPSDPHPHRPWLVPGAGKL